MQTIFDLQALADWDAHLPSIIARLRPGSILALSGPLGAGKTTFAQKIAAALGVQEPVKSPTFALMRTYALTHPILRRLVHVDAYRFETEAEMLALNLAEELEVPGTIALIEWPERIPYWLMERADRVHWLTIEPREGERRRVVWEVPEREISL